MPKRRGQINDNVGTTRQLLQHRARLPITAFCETVRRLRCVVCGFVAFALQSSRSQSSICGRLAECMSTTTRGVMTSRRACACTTSVRAGSSAAVCSLYYILHYIKSQLKIMLKRKKSQLIRSFTSTLDIYVFQCGNINSRFCGCLVLPVHAASNYFDHLLYNIRDAQSNC